MIKIILIILCLMILLSCRGSVTSPNNTDNNSGNITEEPTEPPMTEEEELNKYGLEIDTATAENIRESLEKYFKDNGEYKLILKGVSTKMLILLL